MSDLEIIELIRVSKEEGYCELVNKYSNYVYAIVLSVLKGTGTEEDVEECVSDVFVKLVMDISWTDKGYSTLKAFLGAVSRNTAVNLYHKLSGRSFYLSDDELPEIIMPSASPENRILGNELREIFWKNVKKLGSPDFDILIAQYLYGMPVKKIAAALKMNTAAVHKRSKRARKKLEEIFETQFKSGTFEKEDFYETC